MKDATVNDEEIYNIECTRHGVGARNNNTSAVRRKIAL